MNSSYRIEAKRPASRRRRGASLLEGFMYLVLFGIVAAGSLYMYQSADTGRKTTAAAGELGTVAAAVRNVYAGQPNYNGLANGQIRGSLPARMSLGTAGIQHSFQGPITVASAAAGTADAAFTVSFGGLPTEACKALATKDFGRAVFAMSVNGTAIANANNSRTATAVQSESECDADNNNVIIWTLM